MSHPSISIVLPTYNGARYLDQSIDSVVNQSWRDWELLVVDDASTDETAQKIESWMAKDERIRGIRLNSNLRLPGALNAGFRLARGQYFTWTSDDNWYRPEALERMLAALRSAPRCDIVYSGYSEVDEGGTSRRYLPARPVGDLLLGNPVGPCFLYRGEVHVALEGYDEELFLAEDYDFWLRASRRFQFRALESSLYCYRTHENSLTVQQTEAVEIATRRALEAHLSALDRRERANAALRLAANDLGRDDVRGCASRLGQAIGLGRLPLLHAGFRMVVLDLFVGSRGRRWTRRIRRRMRGGASRVLLAKKILFVGQSADRSGAPISLLHLMRWLRERTDLPFELLLWKGGEIESDYRALAPVSVANRPIAPPRGLPTKLIHHLLRVPFANVRRRLMVREYRRRADIGLVFFNSIASAPLLEVAHSSNIPVLCAVHELKGAFIRSGVDQVLRLFRRSDAIIAVSRAVGDDIAGCDPLLGDRVEIIHGCVPVQAVTAREKKKASRSVREQLGIPEAAMVVGGCGLQAWHKGTDLFVELAQYVRERKPQRSVHFIWLGGTKYKKDPSRFEKQAAQRGISDCVHFPGSTRDPGPYYASFDIFALTSREDSFPLVCLEAAANALPILCFEGAGGAPEFVGDDCGIVVPYLDLNQMADAVLELTESHERRRTLGEAAIAKVRLQNDVDVVIPKIGEVIARHLVSGKPGGAGANL